MQESLRAVKIYIYIKLHMYMHIYIFCGLGGGMGKCLGHFQSILGFRSSYFGRLSLNAFLSDRIDRYIYTYTYAIWYIYILSLLVKIPARLFVGTLRCLKCTYIFYVYVYIYIRQYGHSKTHLMTILPKYELLNPSID